MKQSLKLLFAFVAINIGFPSCLKDDTLIHPDNIEAGVVEFYNNTPITSGTSATFPVYTPTTLELVPSAEFDVTINYASPDPAPQDITVQLAADPAAVTTYNAAHASKYSALPTSAYTIPTSVTIPKGQNRVTFKVSLKPSTFDASKENVLALSITSATQGVISGNFGTAIFNLPLKSIWQGNYTLTIHNNYGSNDVNMPDDPFTEEHVALTTVGPNRLRVDYVGRTYSGYSEYQFSGDNSTITGVTAFSGSVLATSIQEIILVDPVNKIFELRWTWLGRGVRERFVMEK